MSDKLTKLDQARLKALHDARSYLEKVANGGSDTPDGEAEASWRKANAEYDRLDELAKAERKYLAAQSEEEQRVAQQEEEQRKALEAAERKARTGRSDEERAEVYNVKAKIGQALREERATVGGGFQSLPDMADPRFDGDVNVRSFARAAYKRAAAEQRAALVVGTATRGPETVPVTLVNSLFEKLFDDSTVLGAGVTILRTDSGEKLKFPRLAALGALTVANSRVAELGTIQKAEPTFDQVELDAYKYGQISQTSRELIEDSVFDVEALMGQVIGRNMANYLGQELTSGDGSGKPRGILDVVGDTTANIVTGAASQSGGLGGTVGSSTDEYSKLLDVIYKLKPPYRRNAKFMVNDLTVLTLRKIKVNGEANNFAWSPGTAGTPDTLLGYPILVDPYMPTIALSALSIIFCDFSMYYVRLVNDVRVEWSTEYAWDTDLVSVKAVLRADGDAIDDTAFAGFKGNAA